MTISVLVVGGGRLGAALSRRLADDGHQVTVVEPDPERAAVITAAAPQVRVVVAPTTDLGALEAAGVRTADVVAAVSADDADNLVVTALARFEYAVGRTIARIVDPTHAWLFDSRSGVDFAIDQADLLTRLIAEEVPPETTTRD
jgi:trk system potassium uptake protein